jgi:hypothetical protein
MRLVTPQRSRGGDSLRAAPLSGSQCKNRVMNVAGLHMNVAGLHCVQQFR